MLIRRAATLPAPRRLGTIFKPFLVHATVLFFLLLACTSSAFAQGGPPLVTTDPGTPGPENLEINVGVMPILRKDVKLVEVPQFDINYGVGERIQLTVFIPFVWQTATGQTSATGWSNSFLGVKWRFLDHGENGLNIAMFPQIEVQGSNASIKNGIADGGTRLLLPFEFSRKVGPIDTNFECGYYFQLNKPASHNERFFALALWHDVTKRLQLIGEVYNDYVLGAPPKDTYWDSGFRYALRPSFIILFMAGRSFSGNASGQPEFLGYAGFQLLLDKNGRAFHKEK